jgi:hypothetical protein
MYNVILLRVCCQPLCESVVNAVAAYLLAGYLDGSDAVTGPARSHIGRTLTAIFSVTLSAVEWSAAKVISAGQIPGGVWLIATVLGPAGSTASG